MFGMNCTGIMLNELKKALNVLPPKNSDGVWTLMSKTLGMLLLRVCVMFCL